MKNRSVFGGAQAVVVAISLFCGSRAFAQTTPNLGIPLISIPVTMGGFQTAIPLERQAAGERLRPEFEEPGLRLGSFIVKPAADLSERYDSNIFGTNSNARSDFITALDPELHIGSNWSSNAVNFDARGDFQKFISHSSEDQANGDFRASGRLDILRGQYLEGAAEYRTDHEARYSAESQATAAQAGGFSRYPTQYSVLGGRFSYVYAPTRLGFAVDGTVDEYQYSNEPINGGGTAINDDRNRAEFSLSPRVSYELETGTRIFGQVSGNSRQYNTKFDATPNHYQRSSTGYAAIGGVQLNQGGIISGEVFAGYQDQRYDDARLSDNAGLYLGGSLLWNVTRLTSLRFIASRSVQETILTGSSGFWDTEFDARAEHELLRNVILNADIIYGLNQYQGINRNDNMITADAGARWKFNPNFSAGILALWQNRSSTQSVNSFDKQVLMVDVRAGF
jgi:hypothetical protein